MVGKEDIQEEQVIDINDMDMVGGEAYFTVDMVEKPTDYKVIEARAVKTQWGNRVDYTIESLQGYRYIMSSWNFLGKKFKPTEIIGKTITLAPETEKKVRLTF